MAQAKCPTGLLFLCCLWTECGLEATLATAGREIVDLGGGGRTESIDANVCVQECARREE